MKQREYHTDFIKGIGIILMVIGHSAAPKWLSAWLNEFHMAIFFMATGFFWKDSKVETGKNLLLYIWKRIKSLYIPFVICNAIILFLNNPFVLIHFYNVDKWLTFKDTFLGFLVVLLTGNVQELAGATWFLSVLLIISIAQGVFSFLIKKIKKKYIIEIVLFILCCIAAEIISYFKLGYVIPFRIGVCFAAYVAFCLGRVLKLFIFKVSLKQWQKMIVCFVALAITVGATFIGTVGMSEGKIINILFFILVSFSGWFFLWYLSELLMSNKITGYVVQGVEYIGRNTMPIVLWHLLSFKTVSYIWIISNGLPIEKLATFPAIGDSLWLWAIYSVVGIGIPLLLNIPYRLLKQYIINLYSKRRKEIESK